METFHWKIRPDMTMQAEPQVITVKMGDGYEQRRPAGLNSNLAKYNVTIKVRKGASAAGGFPFPAWRREIVSVDAAIYLDTNPGGVPEMVGQCRGYVGYLHHHV